MVFMASPCASSTSSPIDAPSAGSSGSGTNPAKKTSSSAADSTSGTGTPPSEQAHPGRPLVPAYGSGGFLSSSSSLARSSAQVSRSHRNSVSRPSQRGFLIKTTVNQKYVQHPAEEEEEEEFIAGEVEPFGGNASAYGYHHLSRVAVRSSAPGAASHSGMHGVESACYMLSHSLPPISRQRVSGPRAAPASVAVSTHSRGPPYPRAARTLFLTHLLACHTSFFRALFSLQTPVDRSERVTGCWAVRARANPLSLGVWHLILRFFWLPEPKAERLRPAVAPWTQSLPGRAYMLPRTPRAPNYARVSLQ
jgi:hypothetical protein